MGNCKDVSMSSDNFTFPVFIDGSENRNENDKCSVVPPDSKSSCPWLDIKYFQPRK